MPAKRKKKRNNKIKYWIIGVSIILVAVAFVYILFSANKKREEARFALYPDFHIQLPLGFKVHGIDVSSYQGNIYWPAVAAVEDQDVKIRFAFIKATEGLTSIDKQFKNNWQHAKDANIIRGAYHYFLATKSGRLQAQNFIKNVKILPGDLPPVLDVEELYGVRADSMRSRVLRWLQLIESHYGVKPIIYTGASFYTNFLGDEFSAYPLWVAHYFVKETPGVKASWYFWQHNSTGTVNGIKTKVDFNVFSGDTLKFQQLLVPDLP